MKSSILVALSLIVAVDGCNVRRAYEDVLGKLEGEDFKFRPPRHPVLTEAAFLIQKVHGVDEIAGYVTLHFQGIFRWTDPRLGFNCSDNPRESVAISPEFLPHLWTPELFIASSLKGGSFATPFQAIRTQVDSLGGVKQIIHFEARVFCSGHYVTFPFDSIQCSVYITGNIPSDLIQVRWMGEDPVVMPPWVESGTYRIELANFKTLRPPNQSFEDPLSLVSVTDSPGFWVSLNLHRKFQTYFLSLFLPHVMTVFVLCLSLWLPPPPSDRRIGICLTCFIVMVLQFGSAQRVIPKVSYVIGLTGWVLAWLSLIITIFFETSILTFLISQQRKGRNPENESRILRIFLAVDGHLKWGAPLFAIGFIVFYAVFIYTSMD